MELLMLFALSVTLSLIMTPIAIRLNILDNPDSRKIHKNPIPKAGGIGIFLPFIMLLLWMMFMDISMNSYSAGYFVMTWGTLVLTVVGIIDDKLVIRAKTKFVIQIILSAATSASGISFNIFGSIIPDLLLTIIWIAGMINAVNLIDGLDGLAAGTAVISCLGFFALGAFFGNRTMIYTSVLLAGACIGFLRYNFSPARIFMGDTGSLPLGYSLAILGILGQRAIGGDTSFITTLIILFVPIFDTLLSIIRRFINKRPVFEPDRSHFYNLIMDVKGVSHKNTVLIIYCISTLLTIISITTALAGKTIRVMTLFIIIALAVYLSNIMGFLENRRITADSSIKINI